jgi:hypothetical protein
MDYLPSTWDGTLTIASVSMHTPAWSVFDVATLWAGPEARGEDLLIPGRAGRVAMPRRADATTRSLPMLIDGSVDRTGTPWVSYRDGFRRNLLYLRQNVTDPSAGTRTVTLTTPAGVAPGPTLTGAAHVSLEVGEPVQGLWRAVLTLTFPAGGLS